MTTLWVFPMAGRGTRTQSMGDFKPFVEVGGKRIIQWFLCSMKDNFSEGDTLCFITRKQYYSAFNFEREIRSILTCENITNPFSCECAEDSDCDLGQAMTVYHAKKAIVCSETVVVANCDQYISFSPPLPIGENLSFMTVNADFGSSKSYVKINGGRIVEIREKENISNIASTGIYGIRHGDHFIWALEKMFSDNLTVNGEFYVAPSLNYLIKDKNYIIRPVGTSLRLDLGTVGGIDYFQKIMHELA